MSGIAGILNLDGAPADRGLLRRMAGHMAFRGPDAQDVWAGGRGDSLTGRVFHEQLATTSASERMLTVSALGPRRRHADPDDTPRDTLPLSPTFCRNGEQQAEKCRWMYCQFTRRRPVPARRLTNSSSGRYIDKPLGWAFGPRVDVRGHSVSGQERSAPTPPSGGRVQSFGCSLKTEQRKPKASAGGFAVPLLGWRASRQLSKRST